MTEKFIAIASLGKEFFYRRSTMIAVPKSSAQKIAETLTKKQYQIKENEVWHVYDAKYGDDDYIAREIKRYGKAIRILRR